MKIKNYIAIEITDKQKPLFENIPCFFRENEIFFEKKYINNVLDIINLRKKNQVTPNLEIEELKKIIETVFKIEDMFVNNLNYKKKRDEELVAARHIFYWFLYEKYFLSKSRIARLFGQSHSTVICGLRRIENEIDNNTFKYVTEFNTIMNLF